MADAKQTITFDAEYSAALKMYETLTAKHRELGKAFRESATDIKPANDAVGGLADKFKDFKREQVQQGRLVGFYVKEIGEFVQIGKGAQSALGGIGGALVELASGGGKLAILFAGMEAIKGVVGIVRDAMKEAAEQAKKTADAIAKVREEIDKLGKTKRQIQIEGISRIEGALADEQALELVPGQVASQDQLDALWEAREAVLALEAAYGVGRGGLKAYVAELKKLQDREESVVSNQADIAAALRTEGQRSAQGGMAIDAMSRVGKQDTDAIEARRKQIDDSFGRLIADVTAKNAKLLETLSRPEYSDRMAWMNDRIAKGKVDPLTGGEPFDLAKPVMNTNFHADGQKKELDGLKEYRSEMEKLASIGSVVGDTVSGAFSAIGTAIGGTAGSFVARMGEMITSVIRFAVAMVSASAAQVPVVGWLLAAGAGVAMLATLIATMSAVPSYDVGSMSVPRTGLAMVHQGETILRPSEAYAAGLGGGSQPVVVNVNVNALDGASAYSVFRNNRGALARTIRELVNDRSL